MKRQSLVLLAVAFVAAGAAGCFKDPVSSLRNGPAVLSVNESNVVLRTGDSTAVTATLLDNAGNQLAVTGATWTSLNTAVAVVRNDTTQAIPGAAYSKGFIRGVDSLEGGWTNVIVSSRGVADTIRVTVVPAKLTAQHVASAGASLTDTVIVPADLVSGTPAKPIQYTAVDTLVLNGTSLLTFDTSQVTVSVSTTNGSSPGYIVSKTPAQLKVMFGTGTAGKVMVQHLLLTPGNAQVGTIAVDTLISDSVAIAPIRIGPALFGAAASITANVLTVTLPANMTFVTSSYVDAQGDTIKPSWLTVNGAAATIVGRTASTLTAFAPANASGQVSVKNVTMAAGTGVPSVLIDSLGTNTGTFTLAGVVLSSVNLNGGKLGDTVVVNAPSGMAFSLSGASPSSILLGNTSVPESDTGWVLSATANTMKVFARRGGASLITATNLGLATPPPGAIAFPLATADTMTIDSIASDFPLAATLATAHVTVIPASNVDTTYGRVFCPDADASDNCYFDGQSVYDYTTFTLAASHTVGINVAWFGSGNPYSSTAPNTSTHTADLDGVLCNASMACDESDPADLINYAAASQKQPEKGTTPSALAPGQYWAGVIPFTGPYAVVYRLIITLQ